jgi:hypothetical protein
MRLDPEKRTVELTRRNLVTLLAKLDDPDSARTLLREGWAVKAVEDEAHYTDRPHGTVLPEHVRRINNDPTLRDLARREYEY